MAEQAPVHAPDNAVVAGIEQVVATLTKASVAVPIIVDAITSVVGIVKALRGTAPPIGDIIAKIETQVAANDTRGRAEIARLRALIAAEQ